MMALLLAGCGDDADLAAVSAQAPPATVGPAGVEPTEGRLGDATLQRSDAPERRLSPGGRPDPSERRDGPRRDGVGAGAACPNPDLTPSADTLGAMAEATLCLLNGQRADNGLPPVTANARLTEAATVYAADLVAGSYFSHTGRDGSNVLGRIRDSGYIPSGAAYVLGENLAWGSGALATPGSIMNAWMNSPGHRENILNPDFREIGVGIVVGNPKTADGRGATYATEFGAVEGADAAVVELRRDTPSASRDGARPSKSSKASKSSSKARKARKKARRAKARRRAARAAAQRGGKRRAGARRERNAR
jgi:uncharacterized protein YkwD